MLIVDSHCHVSRLWFDPVESLLFQMDRNQVEHAVLVQISAENDNSYQFECVRRYPGRFVSVVKVEETRPDALDELERLVERGARGVRLLATTRSPGEDPLAIWRAAARLRLPVSCLAYSSADFGSDSFAELIEQLPDLTVVIEHMGSFNQPDGELAPYPNRRRVFALSRFPNVYLKVHGIGEFAPRISPFDETAPFGAEVPPLLEMAHAAFGADRLMWGSDYPPVSSREGYRNALEFTMERLSGLPDRDRGAIFGGTALRVFGPFE